MNRLHAFIDYLLVERVQKNWTGDPTNVSRPPVTARHGVVAMMNEHVAVAGEPLCVTPRQLKIGIENMIEVAMTVEDFNLMCTLPEQVVAALTSTGPAQETLLNRIQSGWEQLASGKLGGQGDLGQADYHAAGTFHNRVVALQRVEKGMILSAESRDEQMQRGKEKCWSQYHAPKDQNDLRALLGTQHSGANDLYAAQMRAHTLAATTTADIPDLKQFTNEFAALVEYHAAQGFFFFNV